MPASVHGLRVHGNSFVFVVVRSRWLVATVAYERIRVLFTGYVAPRFELDALGVNVTGVIRTMTAEHNMGELMGHG
jgi:hypothetical protein